MKSLKLYLYVQCTPFGSIQINKWVDNVYLNCIENKLLMIIFERTELETVRFASRAQMYVCYLDRYYTIDH